MVKILVANTDNFPQGLLCLNQHYIDAHPGGFMMRVFDATLTNWRNPPDEAIEIETVGFTWVQVREEDLNESTRHSKLIRRGRMLLCDNPSALRKLDCFEPLFGSGLLVEDAPIIEQSP
jgi:hypothetical protein